MPVYSRKFPSASHLPSEPPFPDDLPVGVFESMEVSFCKDMSRKRLPREGGLCPTRTPGIRKVHLMKASRKSFCHCKNLQVTPHCSIPSSGLEDFIHNCESVGIDVVLHEANQSHLDPSEDLHVINCNPKCEKWNSVEHLHQDLNLPVALWCLNDQKTKDPRNNFQKSAGCSGQNTERNVRENVLNGRPKLSGIDKHGRADRMVIMSNVCRVLNLEFIEMLLDEKNEERLRVFANKIDPQNFFEGITDILHKNACHLFTCHVDSLNCSCPGFEWQGVAAEIFWDAKSQTWMRVCCSVCGQFVLQRSDSVRGDTKRFFFGFFWLCLRLHVRFFSFFFGYQSTCIYRFF